MKAALIVLILLAVVGFGLTKGIDRFLDWMGRR